MLLFLQSLNLVCRRAFLALIGHAPREGQPVTEFEATVIALLRSIDESLKVLRQAAERDMNKDKDNQNLDYMNELMMSSASKERK